MSISENRLPFRDHDRVPNETNELRQLSDDPCRRLQLWTIAARLRGPTGTGFDVPLP